MAGLPKLSGHAEPSALEDENRRLREALEDLLDRKNDYPTDMSTAFKDAMWSEAFDRARAALAGSVSDKDREPER